MPASETGIKDDKVKVITIDSMTGAVVNSTSELTATDISPSDSVDGSVSTSVLNSELRKLESLQAALNNIQDLGKQHVTQGKETAGMISTQSSLLTAPHVQTVANDTVPRPLNVMSQSNTVIVQNNRNGNDNVLKRPISASAAAPTVNKVIITNDPSTSQPQVIPVGQISRPPGSVAHISPGVSLIPQSQSPRTPTKTITISQQGVLSPSRVRMTQVMGSPTRVQITGSPTRVPISRVPSSPAKTPSKIAMIPVTVGRSPLKIAPAAPAIPVIKNSATNSTGPLHTTITMSPSKIVKEGGMVHIIQKPIQPSSNATIVIPPPKTVSAQPVVNKVTIPTNVQQIHVPGNKFHYIRLAAPPSSGAKPVMTRTAAPPMLTVAPGQPQPQLKVAIPPTPAPQHQVNRPSSVQRLILPATSSQVQLRPVLSSGPVPAGAQIIRTTVPAVTGNLGQLAPGGTFITAGASGQGMQGFALVPASYLSQIQQQQQQIQVKPVVSAPAQTSLTTSRADFVPIASSNPVASASSQSKSNATGSSSSTSAVDASGARPRKPCNCTKSQCLKLYCDCFANGEFCHNCNCNNCANNLEHEEERSRAIKTCLERNPHAFHPKIGKGREGERDRRHNKGCNCKRSGCLKNYCECYEAKIMCSSSCKCYGCKNFEESPERKTLMHLADAAEVRVLQQTAAKTKLSSQISDLPSRQTHSAITGERLPFSFVTAEVAEATCACLLAQAEEADRLRMPHVVQERMVIEEFGRCLLQIIESASKTKAKDPDET